MGVKGPLGSGSRVYPPAPFKNHPKLGHRPGGGKWPEATRAWFEAVASLPHARDFTKADWEHARMSALVHALVCEKPSAAMLAELRVREERLGATEVGRARLGIRYESSPEAPKRSRREGLRLVE